MESVLLVNRPMDMIIMEVESMPQVTLLSKTVRSTITERVRLGKRRNFWGGVYAGGSSAKVILRNSLFYDNYAWACGGAIMLDGAKMRGELYDRC